MCRPDPEPEPNTSGGGALPRDRSVGSHHYPATVAGWERHGFKAFYTTTKRDTVDVCDQVQAFGPASF